MQSAQTTGSTGRVLVTGASGFVGRAVVRELLERGRTPVCLVRDRAGLRDILPGASLRDVQPEAGAGRATVVVGDLFDEDALAEAARGVEAAIHLVGIILESRRRGQTFERVHVAGTQRVLAACKAAGVRRVVHMSALGARPDAVSTYHKTKWAAECCVRESGLDWTIFRPSVIHGPDGEFMKMLRRFVRDLTVPAFGFIPKPFLIVPCFGDGQNKLQPVSVLDVAHCFAAAVSLQRTIGQTYELGGPEAMTWRELYRVCRERIPGARRWKPTIGVPLPLAHLAALTVMKLPIMPPYMRFNVDQVQMSQEDSVCDVRPVEETFGIRLRDFRTELEQYADRIE